MGYDIPQPVSQGIDGAQDQENRRIAEIADELRRLCQLYEAELRDGENHVTLIENARPATQVMIDTYMSALGFTKTGADGRFSNGEYEVWDVIPRNVLADKDGDLFVVDAEIRKA